MKWFIIPMSAALLLGREPACAAAKSGTAMSVPKLNYKADCTRSSFGASNCVTQEEDARKTLTEKWSTYPRTDRSKCINTLRTVDKLPSYVILLNCLAIEAEDRNLATTPSRQ